jgi:hypothetical protein
MATPGRSRPRYPSWTLPCFIFPPAVGRRWGECLDACDRLCRLADASGARPPVRDGDARPDRTQLRWPRSLIGCMVADITYVPTWAAFLYLAVVTRRVRRLGSYPLLLTAKYAGYRPKIYANNSEHYQQYPVRLSGLLYCITSGYAEQTPV